MRRSRNTVSASTLALSPLIPGEGKVAAGLDRGNARAYGAECGIIVCNLGAG